jgi:hypothetical protein
MAIFTSGDFARIAAAASRTVHDRHRDVQQNQVRMGLVDQVDGLLSVGCHAHHVDTVDVLEHGPHQRP